MIKVIEPGKEIPKRRVRCKRCDALLEYESFNIEYDILNTSYIKCPCCNSKITIEEGDWGYQ